MCIRDSANIMKKQLLLIAIFFSFQLFSQDKGSELYQLKTYTLKNETQEKMVDTYLKEAYLPALKRLGINEIGVFKIRPGNYKLSNKIYVLIPFASMTQFENLEQALSKDETYLSSGSEYINATHNNKPYERISSTLMRAFPDMPKMKPTKVTGPRTNRVYELRSYEGPTEAMYRRKVDMFNQGGEIELFEKLGFNAVFYADVISGEKMPNLVYMTTFPNMEKRDALWKDFVDSDKWKEISVMEKYLNTVSHADIHLLYPTSYSDY